MQGGEIPRMCGFSAVMTGAGGEIPRMCGFSAVMTGAGAEIPRMCGFSAVVTGAGEPADEVPVAASTWPAVVGRVRPR
jgi:hypothetical protein